MHYVCFQLLLYLACRAHHLTKYAVNAYDLLFSRGSEPAINQKEAVEVQPAEKKSSKSFVREMEFVTMPEFESIPQ